jgi:hypothetical protein
MPINLEQLRQLAQGKRNAPLVAGVRVSVTSAIRLGGMEVVDPKRFPLVEIRARADACPFCQAMNRKVFRKDAFNAYLPPFHINCRCVVVHLQEGMAQENFAPNEVEPLLKHAHFVADRVRGREVRYEALQTPARVEGRDFIFRRVKDPTTGRWVSKLTFRPPPDRTMPSLHLAGLLPPVGEKPVISLVTLGRALRQLPKEVWQLTQELPNAFNASSLIFPPKGSDLARALEQTKELFRIDRENGLVIFNPHRFEEILRQVGDDERLSIALRELFRPILPTVSEASEKYQVQFDRLLTKVASLPPPAPTMTETVRQRLEGVFQRIAENAHYRRLNDRRLRRLSEGMYQRLAEQIQDAPITINLKLGYDEDLPREGLAPELLSDGRYMNSFEVQEKYRRQGYSLQVGMTFESDLVVQEVLFDIPRDLQSVPHSERPIYGAVNVQRSPFGGAGGHSYGRSWVELKDEVKKRTTLYWTNTFGAISEAARKSLANFEHPHNAINLDVQVERSPGYIEAQIHGGVSLKDIKRLVIHIRDLRHPSPMLRELLAVLEALGARVEVVTEEGTIQPFTDDFLQMLPRD